MPVNWSLLNPAIPAAAQTINPFAALNAGRAQAEERIQNQQASELRGMQVKGLQAELAGKESSKKAAALAMQAFQAHQQDPASSIPILQQAFELNPEAAFNTFKSLQEQARASEKAQRELTDAERKQAIEASPFWLETTKQLRAFRQANPNATPEDFKRVAQQTLGVFYDERQLPGISDPTKWDQIEQQATMLLSQNPNEIRRREFAAQQAERAADNARADARLAQSDARLEHYLAGGNQGRGITISTDENGQPVIQIGGSGGPAGTTVQNSQAQLLLALNAAQPSWEQYGKALFDPRLSPTAAGATGAVLSAVRGVSNQIPFTRSVAEWADKQLPVKLNDRQAQQMRYMAETLELQLAPVFSAASKGNPSNKDIQRVREAIGVLGTTDDLNRARFAYGYINNYMTTLRAQAESVTGSGRLPAPRGMQPVVPAPATAQPAPVGGPRRMTREEIRAALGGGR